MSSKNGMRSGVLVSLCVAFGPQWARAAVVRFNPEASVAPGVNTAVTLPDFQRVMTGDYGLIPSDILIPQSLGPLVYNEVGGLTAADRGREDVAQTAMAAITQAATLSAADHEEQLAGAAALLTRIEVLHEPWLSDTAIDPFQPDLPKEVRDLIKPGALTKGEPVPIMDLVMAAHVAARKKLTEKLASDAETRIMEGARRLGASGALGQLTEAGLRSFANLREDGLYVAPPAGAADPIPLGGARTPNWTAIPDEQGVITLARGEARLYMRREDSGWRVWNNVGGEHQIIPVGGSMLIGRGGYMGGYAFNGDRVSRVALTITALPDRVLLWDQASLRGFLVSREGSNIVSVPPPAAGASPLTLKKTAGGLLQRTIIHNPEQVHVLIGGRILEFHRDGQGLYLDGSDFRANWPAVAGRDPKKTDLRVSEKHASRQHTRVLWLVDPVGGQHVFEVLDLGSMNGTGVRIPER